MVEGGSSRQMVDEDKLDTSGDNLDKAQNKMNGNQEPKHKPRHDAKENILSNIKSMMNGDIKTSPSQPGERGMPGMHDYEIIFIEIWY